MSEQTAQSKARFADVTIEFGDNYNHTFLLRTLGERVRGSWSVEALFRRETGGRDVGIEMQKMPPIPGQQMTVSMRKKMAEINDPLEGNDGLLAKINSAARSARIHQGAPYTFVPKQVRHLSDDQLVTLLAELAEMNRQGQVKVIRGELPTEQDIASMAGKVLFDPMSNSAYRPRYREDFEEWAEKVNATQTS